MGTSESIASSCPPLSPILQPNNISTQKLLIPFMFNFSSCCCKRTLGSAVVADEPSISLLEGVHKTASPLGRVISRELSVSKKSRYCTISINSAGGVTCDALAEFFTPAKSRVDKGQGQISARGNIRPPMPEHNVGTPVSKDLWRSAPMKDHDPKCWKGEILTKKGCTRCRNT